MMNRTTAKSQLVAKDPYLKPYKEKLQRRMERAALRELQLTDGERPLSDVANAHLYYGLHRTADGWVFREKAPNATALISFPDFRAFERAFQLLSQVSGRAGRKEVPGKVVIQTYQPNHAALQYVESNDFSAMYTSQIAERQLFRLPPITRMVKITLKHPEEQTVLAAAMQLQTILREAFAGNVMGPSAPLVSRIQNYYLQDFWIKLNRDATLAARKQQLAEVLRQFKQLPDYKKVRVVVNVDA